MNRVTFDLCVSPPSYSVGARAIQLFKNRGLINEGEYSLLLYSNPGRVKIEMLIEREIDTGKFMEILEEEHRGRWEELNSDSPENMRDKCLITRLREEILQGRSPEKVKSTEWAEGIVEKVIKDAGIWNRANGFDRRNGPCKFVHLIINPLGRDREAEVFREIERLLSP